MIISPLTCAPWLQIKAEEAAKAVAKAKKELETTQAVHRNAEALAAAAREKRDQVKKEIKAEREAHLSYMHDQVIKRCLLGPSRRQEGAQIPHSYNYFLNVIAIWYRF